MSRTVYLGTSDFAATVLRRLAGSAHRPELVVTPPDRKAGRGKKLRPPPVAETAAELGLPLLQSANVNEPDSLERIEGVNPDAVCVCAFGQIIREPLLSRWPLLNVHPSLLPRWRGAAPIERAIMAGDERTGVCIMALTEGLDEGPVALCEETPISSDENYGALAPRLAEIGGDLLVRALDLQATGDLAFTEQDDERATYAEKIDRDERRLHPALEAEELARTVRALNPHIRTYIELPGDERLGVREAAPADRELETGVLAAEEESLFLGCGAGALRLDVVQPPGGKPLAAAEYLRGHTPPARAA